MNFFTKTFLQKPYNNLGLTSLFLGLISLHNYEHPFNIHLSDTFYVRGETSILRIMAILLFVLWVLYQMTIKLQMSKLLEWIHVVFTLICTLLIVTCPWWVEPGQWNLNKTVGWAYEEKIFSIIIVFVIAQLIFGLNLMGSMFRKT
jgi:hypothetical protein